MAPNILGACLAVIRWTPVVFITAVIVWSYYAYVLEMCIFTVENKGEAALYLIIYHPLLMMFAWSYYQTIFTNCAEIPKQFYLSVGSLEEFLRCSSDDAQRDVLNRFAQNLPIQCRTASGSVRFCDKCKAIKPDRAHHCSVCGRCVLKMDHHCPWVNNCVCYNNYKFFVQFLGYALMYCVFVAVTSLQYFIQFWTHGAGQGISKFHILFVFFASLMFAISLVSLFGYHLYLTCQNRSTLESFRAPIFRSGPDKDGFSLGSRGNFIEIFGEEKKKWFLPIFSSRGDGVTYPTRIAAPATPIGGAPMASPTPTYNSMEQAASFGDGVNYPVRTIDEDYDSLLGQRQRWAEEGDGDPNTGFDNEILNGGTL